MSDLRWETPPPDGRGGSGKGKGKWAAIAAALRERPGEWAKVEESASITAATCIKSARYSCFAPRGSFDATSRKVSDSPPRFDVWARYVGEVS